MKTNITRPIDQKYGYDLEIETSVSRDGIACHGYINGDCKVVKFGPEAETEVRVHLYRAVTWELNNGARENLSCNEPEVTGDEVSEQAYAAYCEAEPTDENPYGNLPTSYPSSSDIRFNHQTASIWDRIIEEDMQSESVAPTSYAALVEARESAYIAQRDAERELAQLKARLTADIAADPSFKNETSRKAELTDRLYQYDIFIDFDDICDAYRKACNAIEVYQEAAKDQRAKMRYETAQMELRAAELHLQAAQAKQKPVVADMPRQKFVLWSEHEISINVDESCDGNNPIGHVAARFDDDGNFECYETRPGDDMRVYAKASDAIEAAKGLIANPEYERPWALPVYLKMPF